MADGTICDRCHVRPAVAKVRRMGPGVPPVVQQLCEVCLEEGRRAAAGMHRAGLFDELLASLFGQSAAGPAETTPPTSEPVQQVDVTQLFSDATRQALQAAARQAMEWGSFEVDSDHLLWGAAGDRAAARLLERTDVDPEAIRALIEEQADTAEPTGIAPSVSPDAKRVLLAAFGVSRQMGASYIGPEHILVALSQDRDSAAGRVLAHGGVSQERLQRDAEQVTRAAEETGATRTSDTPTVDRFGRDLTELAREGKLDPVIGRGAEVDQTIEALCRRTKNNPVLVGDAGVGKTAIAEGIAQRIVSDDVPDMLHGKRLINLDLSGMLAGTRYRGEFEERLKALVEEVTRHADELLLFVDEVHTVVGAGAAEGAMDAANMLKPALARGDLNLIGATTLDEYRKSIERDAALERRFQPVMVPELDVAETVEVLFGLKDRYEAFHRVRLTDDAVDACARLSDRYISDRFLPDKAVDLMDQASARVRLRPNGAPDVHGIEQEIARIRRDKDQAVAAERYERAAELRARLSELDQALEEARDHRHHAPEVTAEDVAEVVARATGIPVAQLTQAERDRLLALEDQLHGRLVDQDDAVHLVAEAIRRNRAGLGDPGRPVGSFLFLGPTGVGKTELARALAETMFGDDDLMIRLDMSEFQERHTVSRLVGAPPGYVGYEEAGQLTERIRRRPYSVLLLDEIEKAHPDVFNILLQVLDDGRLTDAQGRRVDFKNTVLVMTSNFGAERIHDQTPLGFTAGAEASRPFGAVESELLGLLRRELRPEFLNRIDEIVVFRPLGHEQLRQITWMLFARLADQLRARGIGLRATEVAIDRIAEAGHDPVFGARPLRRALQRLVETELSGRILDGGVEDGDSVTVDAEGSDLRFDVTKGALTDGTLDDWEAPTASNPPTSPSSVAPGS